MSNGELLDETANPESRPARPLIVSPHSLEVVRNIAELREAFRRRLARWHASSRRVFFGAIDGFPGTGKSTRILPPLQDVVKAEAPDASIMELSVDYFIATDRDGEARQKMIEAPSEEAFWLLFSSRDEIQRVLQDIEQMGERGGNIPVREHYEREAGGRVVEGGQIEVPEGRKVVLFEGVDSIGVLADSMLDGQSERTGVMVCTDPMVSLYGSIARDIEKGRRSPMNALYYRTREYDFMRNRLYGRNLELADIVLKD